MTTAQHQKVTSCSTSREDRWLASSVFVPYPKLILTAAVSLLHLLGLPSPSLPAKSPLYWYWISRPHQTLKIVWKSFSRRVRWSGSLLCEAVNFHSIYRNSLSPRHPSTSPPVSLNLMDGSKLTGGMRHLNSVTIQYPKKKQSMVFLRSLTSTHLPVNTS